MKYNVTLSLVVNPVRDALLVTPKLTYVTFEVQADTEADAIRMAKDRDRTGLSLWKVVCEPRTDTIVYPDDLPSTAAVKALYWAVKNLGESLEASNEFNGSLCLTPGISRRVKELNKILACYKSDLKTP